MLFLITANYSHIVMQVRGIGTVLQDLPNQLLNLLSGHVAVADPGEGPKGVGPPLSQGLNDRLPPPLPLSGRSGSATLSTPKNNRLNR